MKPDARLIREANRRPDWRMLVGYDGTPLFDYQDYDIKYIEHKLLDYMTRQVDDMEERDWEKLEYDSSQVDQYFAYAVWHLGIPGNKDRGTRPYVEARWTTDPPPPYGWSRD